MLKFCFKPFPNLKTKRLSLRKLNSKDIDALVKLRSDDRVNEFLNRPKSVSNEDIEKFIKKINNGINKGEWIFWAISLKRENVLIGTICLWNLDKEKSKGEVGFELSPDHQGNGIMKEALKKVMSYAFKEMKLKNLEGFTNEKNVKSINLMKNYNFKRDINLEKKIAEKDKDFRNMVIYSFKS